MTAHPQRLADLDGRLNDARAVVDAAKQRLKDNQEARRALDKDVALYQGRLTKFKDQLSAAKTNKEYTTIQHEIVTAQADLGGVEEKVLERMMEADTIAVDVKQAETAFAATQKVIDAEKNALATEFAAVEKALAQATAAKTDMLSTLDKRVISLFDQIAKVRKGIALSLATRDGMCSVCHVRLRPQVFQQVRTNAEIIQCDSCNRILYYIPPPPPVDMPVVRTGPA